MIVILVAVVVVVEADSVEEAMEANLAEDTVEEGDKMAKAKVVVVDIYEDYIMETKRRNLTLTFPVFQTILT